MRKLLTGTVLVFVVLLAAYGFSSYWFGAQAQKQYDLLLAQASEKNSFEVKTKSYERGIFHSRAVTTIVVKGARAESGERKAESRPAGSRPGEVPPENQSAYTGRIAFHNTRHVFPERGIHHQNPI